jgi:hypothetical protein
MRPSCLAIVSLLALLLGLGGCAGLAGGDPLRVNVAGLAPLPGEGLEARLLVKLRIQNPNDAPIAYDGVSVELELLGKTFASGVSDAKGSIPRFGEALIEVPVTVSALRAGLNAWSYLRDGRLPDKLDYRLSGKLNAALFGSVRFEAAGEIALPTTGTLP